MAVKFELVKAGDTLWDAHRTKQGNTTMSRMGNWPVKVIEINHAEGWAVVSWNGNKPHKSFRRQIERLRRTPYKKKAPPQLP